jgi:hypothetical protein
MSDFTCIKNKFKKKKKTQQQQQRQRKIPPTHEMLEKEKLTLIGVSNRKHALQLQFSRQNGHASAIASSAVLGYLHTQHQ